MEVYPMRKTKTAMRTDLGSLSQDMINEFEEQELQDKKVSVFVTRDEEPTKVQQEYVLMFVENFQAISKQLTNREIQVLLSIVKFSQYKNVFKITQTTIAKDTGIQRSNVSVIMKKLREKIIFFTTKNKRSNMLIRTFFSKVG